MSVFMCVCFRTFWPFVFLFFLVLEDSVVEKWIYANSISKCTRLVKTNRGPRTERRRGKEVESWDKHG